MIFKDPIGRKEIRGQWKIEWLVSITLPPNTFLSLAIDLLLPVQLAGMREDNIDTLEAILNGIVNDFQRRRSNGRTRFVAYLEKKEDHLVIGYDKNGVTKTDCLKISPQ